MPHELLLDEKDVAQLRAGIGALKQIVAAINHDKCAYEAWYLVTLLAALWEPGRFKFDFFFLRGLNPDLRNSCMTLIMFDAVQRGSIHELGVLDAEELEALLVEQGLRYEDEQRQLGRELYRARFPNGHRTEDFYVHLVNPFNENGVDNG